MSVAGDRSDEHPGGADNRVADHHVHAITDRHVHAIALVEAHAEPVSTKTFFIPAGHEGVTFQPDGEPPSGPSSFAVLADGSVVIADTMAVNRGAPRLLHHDRSGVLLSVIDLLPVEAASVADVVTDGEDLALLDIYLPQNRYRVVFLGVDGSVRSVVEIPPGFHLEDGLTGLVWDDLGVLLEFEMGARYARLGDKGFFSDARPLFGGRELEIAEVGSRSTAVRFGGSEWTVERSTDLGGVSLVGAAPDSTLVLLLDEVDTTGSAWQVIRTVRRYSASGELLSEEVLDFHPYVEIARPIELGADGNPLYMAAFANGVEITRLG